MTVTRETVLAVADWLEKQDGGDVYLCEAARMRTIATYAEWGEPPGDPEAEFAALVDERMGPGSAEKLKALAIWPKFDAEGDEL